MVEPSATERDQVEQLADSFMASFRAGQHPSIDQYVEQYPELADQLRTLLAALILLEQNAPHRNAFESLTRRAVARAPCEIGEYLILREIGRGGMGVVYEAVQQSLGRHVALKVLTSPALMNPLHLERFQIEARSAGRLHHSHIVPVFAVGEHEGLHYYAMQFVAGQSLDQVIDALRALRPGRGLDKSAPCANPDLTQSLTNGMLTGHFPDEPAGEDVPAGAATNCAEASVSNDGPPAANGQQSVAKPAMHSEFSSGSSGQPFYHSVARVGLQVAEALAYAHVEGVLHRDIKPSNLLLDTKGNTWVTDFGLAKADESQALTQTGDLVGTLRYMAPERLDGWSDRRSDIYSLGATLYELLTLRPFLEGSSRAQLIHDIRHGRPKRPSTIDRAIPPDLETIVLKSLAAEPASRYHTAEEMADDLRRFLADRPILARRSTYTELLLRWCRRNPLPASLLALVALLIVSISIGSTVAAIRMSQLQKAKDEEAERRFTDASLAEARASRGLRQMGWRHTSLQALGRTALNGSNPSIIDEAIACLAPLDLKLGHPLDGSPVDSTRFTIDPTFTRYAALDLDGTCVVRSTVENREVARVRAPRNTCWPKLNPGGRFLCLSSDREQSIAVWSLAAGQPELIFEADGAANRVADFSSDGRWLATIWKSKEVRIYTLEPFGLYKQWTLEEAPYGLAFRHDGAELAVGTESGIQVHATIGEYGVERIPHSWPITNLAWSRDGKMIAGVDRSLNIGIWNRSQKSLTTLLDGAASGGVEVAFHPQGRLLASRDWDDMLRLWDAKNGKPLLAARIPLAEFRFSPDGQQLAAARLDVGLRFLRLDESPILHGVSIPVDVQYDYVAQIAECPWDPSGRLWAFATPSGTVFWNIATDNLVAKLAGSDVMRCCFDDDGHLWTSGGMGMRRWEFGHQKAENRVGLGPPKMVGRHGAASDYAPQFSQDRQLMALAPGRAAILVRTRAPMTARVFEPDRDMRVVALHGSWLVMGSASRNETTVWDVSTDRLLAKLESRPEHASFSSDGRWLLTVDKNYSLWRTGDWKLHRRLTSAVVGPAAFCPVTSRLAIPVQPGVIALIEPESGHEILRLESSVGELIKRITISRDGSKLFFSCGECTSVSYWDLAAIRPELAKIGLDIEPSLGGAQRATDGAAMPVPSITIDYGPDWPR